MAFQLMDLSFFPPDRGSVSTERSVGNKKCQVQGVRSKSRVGSGEEKRTPKGEECNQEE
jgi:hypothetical protein